MKKCTKCKLEKQRNKFAKDKFNKDGLSYVCKVCKSSYRAGWYQDNKNLEKVSLTKRFNRLKLAAKVLNKGFDITFEKYVEYIKSNCNYCQSSLLEEGGYSIDRADSNKGYLVVNSVACCASCNTGKSNKFSMEEWKIAMEAILSFRKLTAQ